MPSFAEVLVGQAEGMSKKPLTQVQIGNPTSSTERDKARGLYPVMEGPTKTIQMPEMVIKWIKALSDKALVCHFNGYWPKLVDLHSWLDACWKPLLQ